VRVVVDTSVWSLALRRRGGALPSPLAAELASLVNDGRVVLLGAIRQEILSGVRDRAQFERLRDHLRAFSDLELAAEDYEEAALLFTRCRREGIQGSNTDFLICSVALRRDLSIFTTDGDFRHFGRVLPIALHQEERHLE
jgi:predicted nucleic acid-binding protein